MQRKGVTISVEWGYDTHSIWFSGREWSRIQRGQPVRKRGKGYWYEGAFFWDYWSFADGQLLVTYGNESAVGYEGALADVMITADDDGHISEPIFPEDQEAP